MSTKYCPDCKLDQAVENFTRDARRKDGLAFYCTPCRKAREEGGARNYHLRRRYGITSEHFDEMLAEQGGVCAICREAPAEHVDHDHATGRVRGLLCFNCNGTLGQFRDRTDLMLRAVGYLRRGTWEHLIDQPGVQLGFVAGLPSDSPYPPADPSMRDIPADGGHERCA